MLHYQTIEPATLELLKKLQAIPEFCDLRLVGGTSLALQIGHRTSIDLDLFGPLDMQPEEIVDTIRSLGAVSILKNARSIHIFMVDNIKVDIVNYSYPWLSPLIKTDNLRLASLEDICAMKLAAITGRGTRKDFIDVHFLLRYFTLEEMFSFYQQKYADGSPFMVIKSLTYFDDAEAEPEPLMFEATNWETLKTELQKQVSSLS